MKKIILITLFFCSSVVHAGSQDLVKLYQKRNFTDIISSLSSTAPETLDDESLYYLILAHVMLGQPEKAVSLYSTLLTRDTDFYLYKLETDIDLGDMRKAPGFSSLAQTASISTLLSQRKLQRIVKTPSGVFLYKNGLKHSISTSGADVIKADFLDDNTVALYWQSNSIQKKQKSTTTSVLIYNSQTRTILNQSEVIGTLQNSTLNGPHLSVNTDQNSYLFDIKSGTMAGSGATED